MLFQDAVNQFVQQTILMQRSKETVKSYKSCLNGLSRYLVQKYNCLVYMDEVKEGDIEAYLVYLVQDKQYSTNSRQTVANVLRHFIHYCKSKGLLKHNFDVDIPSVRTQRKERCYLTEKEVKSLVDAVDNSLIKVVIQTLYYTGLRISELTKLTMSDVDLKEDKIHVRAGKGGNDRNIPISKKLKTLLNEYREHIRVDTGSDSFFCTKTGGISKSYISKMFQRVREASDIKKEVTFHVMRHSFASSLLRKGVDIAVVQKLLGHTAIETTGIYLHSNDTDLRDAVNKL